MQHRQESNDSVNKQDADMNKDDREKQDPMEEESKVTVSRNRETQDIDSKMQRLPSVATHHSKPQRAEGMKDWDPVSGGELR